jgi:hypothetical protein
VDHGAKNSTKIRGSALTTDSKSAVVRLITSEGASSATTKAARRDKRGAAVRKRILEKREAEDRKDVDGNGLYMYRMH